MISVPPRREGRAVEVRLNADTTMVASPKHPCVYVGGVGFGGVRISGDPDATRRLLDALAEIVGRDGQPAARLVRAGDAAEAASEAYASGWDAAIASIEIATGEPVPASAPGVPNGVL
jgi:hypothetical protein